MALGALGRRRRACTARGWCSAAATTCSTWCCGWPWGGAARRRCWRSSCWWSGRSRCGCCRQAAKAPAVVGCVVLGSVTLLAVPVLGRFGERSDNPTLLDRNYTAGLAGPRRAGRRRRGHGLARRLTAQIEAEVSVARVLVVDDDPTVREVVVSYLRAADHEVVEAGRRRDRPGAAPRGPARPRRARPDAARHRRDRGLSAAARGRRRPGDHADRARRGDRPGARARGRRRRLRHEAVQPARARPARRLGAAPGGRAHRAAPAGRRRPRGRRGRPRGVPRRASRSRSPAASSTCCASCSPTRARRTPATSCSSRSGAGRSATSRR